MIRTVDLLLRTYVQSARGHQLLVNVLGHFQMILKDGELPCGPQLYFGVFLLLPSGSNLAAIFACSATIAHMYSRTSSSPDSFNRWAATV
jgi:hypothetical protein